MVDLLKRTEATVLDASAGDVRHVTLFFSDIAGFADWNARRGDVEAARIANRLLAMQEIIITRDGAGQVLQFSGDSVFAVFDNASAALNRALEIQRLLGSPAAEDSPDWRPNLRIGLHMGEVLFREGERLELISRHVNRARRVMEAAASGQIFASEAVVEAGKDFLDTPREFLAIQHHGEYFLQGAGAIDLCEVADLRFRKPEAPRISEASYRETMLASRLELAGYRIAGRLGEGTHGVVYRATQSDTGQPVAIKVFNPALVENAATRRKLVEATERLRQQKVSGVGQIIDERLDHSPPFLVMPLVEGQPVDAALAEASPERMAKVFREICRTLGEAHSTGIFHGDLKPGNILIQADNVPIILDFGTAMLQSGTDTTHPTSVTALGLPAYLAPETVLGAVRGPQTDVYSLGVLLFKVLAGREPFQGNSIHQIVQAHLHEDPPLPAVIRPDVADGLQRICLKALEKNVADRYPSVWEMAADFDRFLRGELVRTRPTAYDNLLFHRVQQHVEQISDWTRRGLLNPEESHRLLASYEGLQRRGIPVVMEGRLYRLWQTLVYVGGWAVINGSMLWLVQHWNTLSRFQKLLLGSVPALTAFGLATAMWKLERFRLTFVALLVGIIAVPLLAGVWLYEFKVAAEVPEAQLQYEVFHTSADSTQLTNRQLTIAAWLTFVAALTVMCFTLTVTHSAQAALASFLFYSACLLWFGLKIHVDQEEWATLAVKYTPLLFFLGGFSKWLLDQPRRFYQASPWIYLATLLSLAMLYAIPVFGLKEWTHLSGETRTALSYLLLTTAGGIEVTLGLTARHFLRHRCRLATLTVVFAGLISLLAGLGLAALEKNWPPGWWSPMVFGQPVPAPHLALPVAALGITVLACRYQMFAFLLVGLAGFAASIHVLGHLYFETISGWPKLLMSGGAICFFAALYLELRRTRGNAIDDVVSQTRL